MAAVLLDARVTNDELNLIENFRKNYKAEITDKDYERFLADLQIEGICL